MNNEYVLEMNHITKKYGENRVLNDVTLKVKPGEILALIGENGAGKSTIMNILFGMPVIRMTGGFEGEIRFNGQPVTISSPIEAAKLGIGTMVLPMAVVNTGVTVGNGCIINIGALIDHDTVIEDGVHLAPGAIVKAENRIPAGIKLNSGEVIENRQYPL